MKSLQHLFTQMKAKNGFAKLKRWNTWDTILFLFSYVGIAYFSQTFIYQKLYIQGNMNLFFTIIMVLLTLFVIETILKFRYQLVFCLIPGYAKVRREAINVMKNWQTLLSIPENQRVLARALDAYVKEHPSSISARVRFKQILEGMEQGFGNGERMQLNLCWFYARMKSESLAEFENYLDEMDNLNFPAQKEKEVGKYEF